MRGDWVFQRLLGGADYSILESMAKFGGTFHQCPPPLVPRSLKTNFCFYSFLGGIDHHLGKIIFDSKQFSIPIIYSMSRQTLGITLKRKVPASVVGIFNYAGVEVCLFVVVYLFIF